MRSLTVAAAAGCVALVGAADAAEIDWVPVGSFVIARTETTIGQFRRFAEATRLVTHAERAGGGLVYEAGWVQKRDWTWRAPFGASEAIADDEPAVHVTYEEAQAFCRWAGGRLPTDTEWVQAAYTESRPNPPAPFVRSRTYTYPTGDSPAGAQCLDDCGPQAQRRAIRHGARLWRGHGHARMSSTPAGVNGMHEMGGNAWEWIGEAQPGGPDSERPMRGGSWWYGAAQMRADSMQRKPGNTAVVYIGFRCARDRRPE